MAPVLAIRPVTESEMAIALAKEGGLGIVHKNMSVGSQTEQVMKVKRSANGIIVDPVTLPPDERVGRAAKLMDEANVSGIPIVHQDHTLAGILTRRDLRFLEDRDTPWVGVLGESAPLAWATSGRCSPKARWALASRCRPFPCCKGFGSWPRPDPSRAGAIATEDRSSGR